MDEYLRLASRTRDLELHHAKLIKQKLQRCLTILQSKYNKLQFKMQDTSSRFLEIENLEAEKRKLYEKSKEMESRASSKEQEIKMLNEELNKLRESHNVAENEKVKRSLQKSVDALSKETGHLKASLCEQKTKEKELKEANRKLEKELQKLQTNLAGGEAKSHVEELKASSKIKELEDRNEQSENKLKNLVRELDLALEQNKELLAVISAYGGNTDGMARPALIDLKKEVSSLRDENLMLKEKIQGSSSKDEIILLLHENIKQKEEVIRLQKSLLDNKLDLAEKKSYRDSIGKITASNGQGKFKSVDSLCVNPVARPNDDDLNCESIKSVTSTKDVEKNAYEEGCHKTATNNFKQRQTMAKDLKLLDKETFKDRCKKALKSEKRIASSKSDKLSVRGSGRCAKDDVVYPEYAENALVFDPTDKTGEDHSESLILHRTSKNNINPKKTNTFGKSKTNATKVKNNILIDNNMSGQENTKINDNNKHENRTATSVGNFDKENKFNTLLHEHLAPLLKKAESSFFCDLSFENSSPIIKKKAFNLPPKK